MGLPPFYSISCKSHVRFPSSCLYFISCIKGKQTEISKQIYAIGTSTVWPINMNIFLSNQKKKKNKENIFYSKFCPKNILKG